MSNIIITVSGTSFMNMAGPSGPYIPIKYFVPVYDHRYDTSVHPTSALIPVSAGDFTSAVNPFGDIIWNIDSLSTSSYSMTQEKFLVYDPNQSGTTTITNSSFNATSYVTLRTGRPLSHSISATSFVYSYPSWTVDGYTMIPANSATPSGYSVSTQKFYNTVSYAPISSAAGGNARGLFKVRLGNQVGNFKFNKIALYAAKYLADGSEDMSVDPVLFGIAMLKEPIIKSNDGFNISFFELDVELQFSSNGYFSNVSFLQNTEWNYVASQNSLWFDGSAILGSSAVPGSWSPAAKLHLVDPNHGPFLRMTDDNVDNYVDYNFNGSAGLNTQTVYHSMPAIQSYFNTSGGSNYASIHTYLDSTTFQRYILMESFNSVSGIQQSGLTCEFFGYLEAMDIYVNATTLARFRSDGIYGLHNTLVMGVDANSKFEHPNKFLTLHGGALLVGSTLVSGDLSASGNIDGYFIRAAAEIQAPQFVASTSGTGFIAYGNNQMNHFDKARFYVSADFQCPVSMTGALTIYNDVNVDGNIYVDNMNAGFGASVNGYITSTSGVEAYGSNQLSLFDRARFSVSADFRCPVTISGRTTISNVLSASSVSAHSGFNESNRPVRVGYWQTYSPTLTAYGGGSLAVTDNYCAYTLVGNTIMVSFYITVTVTGVVTIIDIPLPSSYVADSIGNIFSPSGSWRNGSYNNAMVLGGAAGSNAVNMRPVGAVGTVFTAGVNTELRGLIILPVV